MWGPGSCGILTEIEAAVNHWDFVLAAYAVAALVLAGYWWRVERRIRALQVSLRDVK